MNIPTVVVMQIKCDMVDSWHKFKREFFVSALLMVSYVTAVEYY